MPNALKFPFRDSDIWVLERTICPLWKLEEPPNPVARQTVNGKVISHQM